MPDLRCFRTTRALPSTTGASTERPPRVTAIVPAGLAAPGAFTLTSSVTFDRLTVVRTRTSETAIAGPATATVSTVSRNHRFVQVTSTERLCPTSPRRTV